MNWIEIAATRTRIATYFLLFGLIWVVRFGVVPVVSDNKPIIFLMLEFAAALLAFWIGVQAIIRFYTQKNGTFLLVGIGFLGAGFVGSYPLLLILRQSDPFINPLVYFDFVPYWNLSQTFLALMLVISLGLWQKRRRWEQKSYFLNGRLVGLFAAATLVNALVFFVIHHVFVSGLTSCFSEFLTATLFLWALLGYLNKKVWQTNWFDHWLIISLILSYSGQMICLMVVNDYLDALFALTQWLKLTSYFSVMTGLLLSMYAVFNQAQQQTLALASSNRALEHEISERRRAEKAEQEQRQLAEALREVGLILSSTLNFHHLLDRLLDQIALVLPYDTANVMLVEGDAVRIVCTRGYEIVGRSSPGQIALVPTLQRMAETKEPLVISDTAKHQDWVNGETSPHVRSWAGAPIVVQDRVIAFLALNHSQANYYQMRDATRLTSFAGQASIAIQNAQLYDALQRRVHELVTLNHIGQLVNSSLDLQATLRVVTESTTALLDVAAASVVLLDKEANDLWFAAASGEAADFVLGKRLALGQGILGWVVAHGEPLLIANVKEDNRHFAAFDQKSGFMASSILCVPLIAKEKTIGAIETMNKRTGPFYEEDLRLLMMLANPAAAAIENARLYEQAQQEIRERLRIEADLESERTLLTQRVEERTADLTATNLELARAVRLKDEFLASMSHELRTPLNTILGMSEALQEGVYGELNSKQINSLRHVEESGRHLLALINDILDLSKVEAGKLEIELEPVAVESVCQASLNFVKRDAHKKRLQISFVQDEKVSVVRADERRLKQILVNLLSNAVKFTPDGGKIGLEVYGDAAAQTVTFAVWDTGIGIALDDRERLFKPFVQLDSRLSRQYTGTGLGLSLVYRMVQLHQGGIVVESELGRGSRFSVILPWLSGQISPAQPDVERLTPLHVSQNAVILIAEDNELVASTMDEYLSLKGYRILMAQNGYDAVELTQKLHPDLVLMDIQMPGLDGLEAIRRIRLSTDVGEQIPIIALTALAMPGDKDLCLQAGATNYVSKPVPMAHLVQMIEAELKGK